MYLALTITSVVAATDELLTCTSWVNRLTTWSIRMIPYLDAGVFLALEETSRRKLYM